MGEASSFVVTLSDEEMRQAAQVAKDLHDRLRRRGVRDGHGLRKEDATPEMEAGGAAAELAAAKFYGVPWAASQPGHKADGPDIGTRTQVRSSNKPRSSHHLIVRVKDITKYKDVPFILVIQTGNQFEIKGWASSFDAVNRGREWDGGDKGRPPAYFLHETKLNPPNTLRAEDM
jgi:hypothetical protein